MLPVGWPALPFQDACAVALFPCCSVEWSSKGQLNAYSCTPRHILQASLYTIKPLLLNGEQVILNERAVKFGSGYSLERSGRQLEADIVYWCTGGTPNTDFLTNVNPTVLNERGYVKVSRPSFYVKGCRLMSTDAAKVSSVDFCMTWGKSLHALVGEALSLGAEGIISDVLLYISRLRMARLSGLPGRTLVTPSLWIYIFYIHPS